jgi:Rrf2 family protein
MLKLSRKSVLAIEAVLDVAYNATNCPVQSREITDRQGIPQRYLEQVMQRLVRDGILRGVRGPRGGYMLAKQGHAITLGDVIRIVNDVDVDDDDSVSASELGTKVVSPLWSEIEGNILSWFDDITISDLCDMAERRGVMPASVLRKIAV